MLTTADRRPPTADEAVAAVTERLTALPADWRSLPNAEVKQLLKAVVADLQIDLQTLETTLTVRVSAAAAIAFAATNDGRATFTSAWPSLPNSTEGKGMTIDKIICRHERKAKCFICQRQRPAA